MVAFALSPRAELAIAFAIQEVYAAATPDDRLATHSAVLPRVADGCIAGMMRKPNRAGLTSDAALLLR